MKSPSLFKSFKDLLVTIEVGEEISRKRIKEELRLSTSQMMTLDNYRRLLEIGNYLEMVSNGLYRKIREVDDQATIKKIKADKEKFNKVIGFPKGWGFKVNSKDSRNEALRKIKWEKELKASRLSIDEFLHKNRAKIGSEKFGV